MHLSSSFLHLEEPCPATAGYRTANTSHAALPLSLSHAFYRSLFLSLALALAPALSSLLSVIVSMDSYKKVISADVVTELLRLSPQRRQRVTGHADEVDAVPITLAVTQVVPKVRPRRQPGFSSPDAAFTDEQDSFPNPKP